MILVPISDVININGACDAPVCYLTFASVFVDGTKDLSLKEIETNK